MPLTCTMQDDYNTSVLQIMELGMKQKRKRAPGGGRKPTGPFTRNAAQLTIRMPADMRTELEAAAQKQGWSLTQELLWRLRVSLSKERVDRRSPSVRALCFLISETAESVSNLPVEWHRDPFLFRGLKLAITKVLDALEPAGEMRSPFEKMLQQVEPGLRAALPDHFMKWVTDAWRTPETLADFAASATLRSFFQPKQFSEDEKAALRSWNPSIGDGVIELMYRQFYGMSDARRDLGINELKEDKS
jgi:hypothetical protein